MWGGDWKSWIDGQVEKFNASRSDIKVKPLAVTSDGETKFIASVAGGNPPDVFTGWGNVIPTWAESETIMCLDELISKNAPDLDDFLYPIASDLGKYKGKTYCMPINLCPLMLFWNKDLFKEVGLDPEKYPVTIGDLDAMQDKFWKFGSKGQIDRMGFYPTYLRIWVPAFGGRFIDENNKPTLDDKGLLNALKWFESFVTTKGYSIEKIDAFTTSIANSAQATNPFLTEKAAFTVDGVWLLTDIQNYAPDMNYGICPLPYSSDGGFENANLTMADFDVIANGSKHPEEAFEFLKWMVGYGGNEEAAGEFVATGGNIPAAQKVVDSSSYKSYLDEIPARYEFMKALDSENNLTYPSVTYGTYYMDRLEAAEERVMHGAQTAEEALKQVADEVAKEAAKQEATN
jgi:multiple sugar transport system substrate-binding protein